MAHYDASNLVTVAGQKESPVGTGSRGLACNTPATVSFDSMLLQSNDNASSRSTIPETEDEPS
jgi:hypothetical protein